MNDLFSAGFFARKLRKDFRGLRVAVALTTAGAALTFLPGCIFLAVRAVKAVNKAVNPPQAPLFATETFFGGTVSATVRLIPFNTEARERWLKRQRNAEKNVGDGDDEVLPGEAREHTVLLAVVRNTGTTDLPLTVVSLESVRGKAPGLPLTVLLAPDQRNVLMPVSAEAPEGAEPVQKLEITLALKKAGEVETKKIELKARAGAND